MQSEGSTCQSVGASSISSVLTNHTTTQGLHRPAATCAIAATRHVVFVCGTNLQFILLCKFTFRGMAIALLSAVAQDYTVTGLFFMDFIYEEQFSVIHYEQK